jgi:hypothetical protein
MVDCSIVCWLLMDGHANHLTIERLDNHSHLTKIIPFLTKPVCNSISAYYLCPVMKKIIAFFTVIVYFVFACGVIVTYHFCMDRFDSFSLYKPIDNWCSKMHAKKNGCCHDEVKIIKLQNDYQISSAFFSVKDFQPVTAEVSQFLVPDLFSQNILGHTTDHSPPLLLSQQDTYLQNGVFRI